MRTSQMQDTIAKFRDGRVCFLLATELYVIIISVVSLLTRFYFASALCNKFQIHIVAKLMSLIYIIQELLCLIHVILDEFLEMIM
jgi:histidinol phosphatase-like enzyme